MKARLKQYLQKNPNGILVLNASRTALYNDVIQTLDLLRQVGGNRVSLGIIPGPSQILTNLPKLPILPNTPIPGYNPPANFNPTLPTYPNSFPGTGQGVNPGISPVIPSDSMPEVPVAPESGLNTPMSGSPVVPSNSESKGSVAPTKTAPVRKR